MRAKPLKDVSSDGFSFAYLITAPRFLGYQFNPVSFWYLYSADRRLESMILEVNNTFDERRAYLLKKPLHETECSEIKLPDAKTHDSELSETPGLISKQKLPIRFTNKWHKDFHVSPFNPRTGFYTLSALDPFSENANSPSFLENVITYSSPESNAKMVARVFSVSPPIEFDKLTIWQSLRFLSRWWWTGFMTYPRIVKEAAKLFFWHKMRIWFRPEVRYESIGRQETASER
ncbi:MAG: hypothetical protein M1829_002329 [Trizodia sp. TS-e1964]|nr:MAG: hypothetical protein M1829_002329 [Trizodia sp. TS-e1964]